jgi:hemoglobin
MTGTGHDITTRADIERLVDTFYAQVRADEILAPIFDDAAHTDWAHHLPKMYDFWETVLFGAPAYRGQPIGIHVELATRVPLGEREFGRWLTLFVATVDAAFLGPQADEAKRRAARIASVMQHHIRHAAVAPAAAVVDP